MSLIALVRKYSQPNLSIDEMEAKAIAELLDGRPLPQNCGFCGSAASPRNPLVMQPYRRTDSGGPRGTLYRAICGNCEVRTRK